MLQAATDRGGSGRRLVGLAAAALAVAAQALYAATPAFAVDHNIRIREIFAGATTGGQGASRFVELQMANSGQNQVALNRVHFYDAAGNVINTSAFPANVANSANQSSILVATQRAQSFFGIAADLTMPATGLPPKGGQVCYEDVDDNTAGFIDCVAWGSFAGVSPSPTGTPFNPANGIPDGKSIERDISANNANLLEATDDTNDSAADFDAIFPVGPPLLTGSMPGPRNNAGATTTTAADALVDGAGVLSFDAAAGVKNELTVGASGAFWRLTDKTAPIEAGAGCEQVTVNRVRCAQAGVTSLNIDGGDANDKITTPDGIDATVDGGPGDDILTTRNGADTVLGGTGRDILDAGTGPDLVDAGDQQDTVTYERRTASQPVVIDLDAEVGDDGGAEDGAVGARDTILNAENLRGGAGDDAITGNDGPNRLLGGAGADDIFGRGGSDEIRAKDGTSDDINCGAGAMDKLFADPIDVFPTSGADACEIVSS